MRTGSLRIFFDGGCRPNPGAMEVAAVTRGIAYIRQDIGHGGSEKAEWLALLHAVGIAVELGAHDVELIGDSRSVIGQASGSLKCREAWRQKNLAAYRAAVSGFRRVRLRHVARSRNLAGIALARTHPR